MILTELSMVLALVLLNGVFSGAEIAILSLRRTRLEELAEGGSRAAVAVTELRANPERFLAAVQIGITVVGAAAAAFGGASITARLAPWLAAVPGLEPWADQLALTGVVGGIAFLQLVLGELVPKSLALRYAEPYSLVIGPVLALVATLTRPLIWLLTVASNVVLRLFGDRTSFTEARLSADELRQLVDEAAIAGSVDPAAGEIATRALAFSGLDASMMMLPAHRIVRVPRGVTIEVLVDVELRRSHARVLVYDGDPDNIVGALPVREALARAAKDPSFNLNTLVRDVLFVPETMTAPVLLRALQGGRHHLAVVVDETGGVRGLVSVEDLVEELVGEILNEDDASPPSLQFEADGSLLVDAARGVHEVNRDAGIELPEGETFATVAGLVIDLAGQIPAVGERFDTGEGYEIEVVEATRRVVKRVRVRRTTEHGDG